MITTLKIFENKIMSKFIIPRPLIKFQKMKDYLGRNPIDLYDMKSWKTKVILANSAAEGIKIGDWDDVGYILISQISNHIIPVARADEHHQGYDLLWDLHDKGIVKHMNFTSIFWSNNYFYYDINDDQAKKDLKAVKKYLEYGGNNTNLLVTYTDDDHRQKRIEIDFKTFVKFNGDVSKLKEYIDKEGELASEGNELIEFFEYLSYKLTRYYLDNDKNDNDCGADTPKGISDYVKWWINDRKVFKDIDFLNILYFKNELIRSCNKFDISKIEQLIYSFDGLKNKIHQMLRKKDKKLIKYFGNLELALSKFNQLGR